MQECFHTSTISHINKYTSDSFFNKLIFFSTKDTRILLFFVE